MTRIGKIARLPRTVRETLNRRLLDGEPGPRLAAWLNSEPEVKKVLDAEFGGRAVNAQNLTEWRQGGYADWGRHQLGLELMGRTMEQAKEFEAVCEKTAITDRAAEAAGLALLFQLKAAETMAEGPEKRRATLEVVHGLVRLRRSDHAFRRGLREAELHERGSALHERELARQDWDWQATLMDDKLRAEEWVNAHAAEVRGCFQVVRDVQAAAKTAWLPAPVAEFFATETEFEKRHAEAVRMLKRYAHLREHQLPPDAEWTEPASPVVAAAAVKVEVGPEVAKAEAAVNVPEVAKALVPEVPKGEVVTNADAARDLEKVETVPAGAETGAGVPKSAEIAAVVPDVVPEPAATPAPAEAAPASADEPAPAGAVDAGAAGAREGAKPAEVVAPPEVPAWVPPPPDDNSYHIQKMKRRAERLKYFDSWEPRPRWGDGLL